jgi:amino acid adenylation domain-containing protein
VRSGDPGAPPIGRPISRTQAQVVDRHLRPVPLGAAGELCLGGAGLARGYLGRPDLTAERFIPDPFGVAPGGRLYRTGDLVRWRPDGRLDFLGRLDHQVKIRGFRIELGEIETALGEIPAVRETVLLVREDAPGERVLVAYVAPAAGCRLKSGELRKWLSRRLPEFMVPSRVVILDELPRTPNGKVDRAALPAPDRSAGAVGCAAPCTLTEEVLTGIWEDLLGREGVGSDADFFELGGHSLLATRLIFRIHRSFGVELAVRDVFERPTIAQLGGAIDEALQGERVATAPIEPAPRSQPLVVSFAQERLWFVDRLAPGRADYNLPLALRVTGGLDLAVFTQALREVVHRHEALRTTFAELDGHPAQVVGPPGEIDVPVVDLSGLPAPRCDDAVAALLREEAGRPFDLRRGPLLRSLVLRAPAEHAILIVLHHIVGDAWSLEILRRELSRLYSAYAAGELSPLAPLPIQYADFAFWQRQWLRGERLEERLSYWRERLCGAPPLLELPSDRPRPPFRTSRGAQQRASLPANLVPPLAALSRSRGASLFMTLLAAFQALLSRWTGALDLCVGAPIAGRDRPETEDLIGFFVNLLVLRTNLGGDPDFADLLDRIREVTLGAYAHRELPFEKLVDELRPERNLGHSPLVQVIFTADVGRPSAVAPAPESWSLHGGTAKFDLTWMVQEERGRLSASLEHSTDLFDTTTIRRLLGAYEILLEGIAANPRSPLAALPLLSEGERHQILVEWNDTGARWSEERPVHERVLAVAAVAPEEVALVQGRERMTYGELAERSERLACSLCAHGVGPEVVVAVCAERSLELVVGWLAALRAGGAYVPLDPAHPDERLAGMLADSGARVLLTQRRLAPRLAGAGAEVILLDSAWEVPAAPLTRRSPLPEELAYLIYTSGSTGRPKGVEVTHGTLSNLLAWHESVYGITRASRATQVAGLGFDAAVWEVWPYLARGASLHLAEPETIGVPERLRDWLVEQGITVSFLPTPLAEAVLTLSWPETAALGHLLTGGDRLHGEAPAGLPFRLINHYGPTESTVVSTYGTVGVEPSGTLPSIGRPIANLTVYVLDAKGREVPLGAPGELSVGGGGLARGYRGSPVLTAERFVPDPFGSSPGGRLYRTGDRVRYLTDGRLMFLGRLDDQVKIRGVRIELGEIEAALARHSGVAESAVVLREDRPGDLRLVAYCVPAGRPAPRPDELRELVRCFLPESMVPQACVLLEALPLSANGKVDRKALPAPAPGSGDGPLPPRDTLEAALARLWCEVLDLPTVGVRDDFFALGGHSLLAVRLLAGIERRFRVTLPVATFFAAPTVERLAAVLRGPHRTGPEPCRILLRSGAPEPPLFLVHPGGGHVFAYAALARRLREERPIYGFQARGWSPGQPADRTIEAMSTRYLGELRAAHPEGPCLLGGWSLGGLVAYEMACRLAEEGREVPLLALLDTTLELAADPADLEDEAVLAVSFVQDLGLTPGRGAVSAERLRRLKPGRRLSRLYNEALRRGVVAPDLGLRRFSELFELFRIHARAARDHVPGRYAGKVHLLAARNVPVGRLPAGDTGWRELAREVEICTVDGDHFSLLREPYVSGLAERLDTLLANAVLEREER